MDEIFTTNNEVAAIVPELWSANYFAVLLQNLAYNSLISTEWEGEIKDLGSVIHLASFPEFGLGEELAEDAESEAEATVIGSQALTINKRVVKDFIVSKKAMLQSLPMMDKLRDLAVYAIMKRIQLTIIETIIPSASAPDHTIAYTSALTLALVDLIAGKKLLDEQNVPFADRHMVVGSGPLNDIFNIVGFMSSDFSASGGLNSGNVPSQLLGFAPHFTTAQGTTTTLFHRSFMTMATQQGMDVKLYDLGVVNGKRATRVNLDTLYGLKQMDNKRVVTIN